MPGTTLAAGYRRRVRRQPQLQCDCPSAVSFWPSNLGSSFSAAATTLFLASELRSLHRIYCATFFSPVAFVIHVTCNIICMPATSALDVISGNPGWVQYKDLCEHPRARVHREFWCFGRAGYLYMFSLPSCDAGTSLQDIYALPLQSPTLGQPVTATLDSARAPKPGDFHLEQSRRCSLVRTYKKIRRKLSRSHETTHSRCAYSNAGASRRYTIAFLRGCTSVASTRCESRRPKCPPDHPPALNPTSALKKQQRGCTLSPRRRASRARLRRKKN